jgi:hypothetical protein
MKWKPFSSKRQYRRILDTFRHSQIRRLQDLGHSGVGKAEQADEMKQATILPKSFDHDPHSRRISIALTSQLHAPNK